jgi:hypothetical protein
MPNHADRRRAIASKDSARSAFRIVGHDGPRSDPPPRFRGPYLIADPPHTRARRILVGIVEERHIPPGWAPVGPAMAPGFVVIFRVEEDLPLAQGDAPPTMSPGGVTTL